MEPWDAQLSSTAPCSAWHTKHLRDPGDESRKHSSKLLGLTEQRMSSWPSQRCCLEPAHRLAAASDVIGHCANRLEKLQTHHDQSASGDLEEQHLLA